MRIIILFLIIIALVAAFSYLKSGKGILLLPEKSSQVSEEISQEKTTKTKTISKPETGQPLENKSLGQASIIGSIASELDFLVDTNITSGPEEGKIIEDNMVVFEFEAKFPPQETKKEVSFETKVEGVDKDWVLTYSKRREITFPSGPKEYTFFVRAKTKDSADPSPAKRTFKINISPYFEKVKFSDAQKSVSTLYYLKPSLITLIAWPEKEEKINITNWKIESKKGTIIIPKGIERYYHYYDSASAEDIFVKRGDNIYLSSAPNPLGENRNFRLNKCFGWLSNYYDFPIYFSKNCPKPTKKEISTLNPCCQELIFETPRCEKPDYSKNIKTAVDSECSSYINEISNYPNCFLKYSRDKDFFENNWHIYLNKNIVAPDVCDTLYLRDQNGFLVDSYDYGKNVCR